MTYMNQLRMGAAAGAVSVLFSFSPAQAYSITAQIAPDPTTIAAFTLENYGSGGAAGLVSSAGFAQNGVTYSFGGTSGVYVGDVSGITRSPLRDAAGDATNDRYLNARAGTAGVTMVFTIAQTAFNMLWGSLDPVPASYNQLIFTFGGAGGSETISGAEVFAAVAGAVPGVTNVAVQITGLSLFNTLTVTATQEAFEFVPGTPVAVPAPASLALFGAGLLGLGLVRRRRQQA